MDWLAGLSTATDPGLGEAFRAAGRRQGYEFCPVYLDDRERDAFYHGFSNEIIWPLFHDLQSLCNFDPEYWRAYRAVNDRYAEAIAEHAGSSEFLWVHDYQLMGVGGARACAGCHRHPRLLPAHSVPATRYLRSSCPGAQECLRSLLAYDLIGFQTRRDRRNFVDCVRELLPGCGGDGQRGNRWSG